MNDVITPTLGRIRKHRGLAGQVAYTVPVTYPDEPSSTVTFLGSSYGGPVLMMTKANPEGTWVVDPERFGKFSSIWVQRFFGAEQR